MRMNTPIPMNDYLVLQKADSVQESEIIAIVDQQDSKVILAKDCTSGDMYIIPTEHTFAYKGYIFIKKEHLIAKV